MYTRLLIILFVTILFNLVSGVFPLSVSAAPFASAYLRLNQMAPSAPLSGLVCAKPSSASAGTEAKISVTFPNDFTVSSTSSNWSTDTTELPSGTTAWPGISSSATSVSGRIVTFASSDLVSSSNTYCFTFESTASSTGTAGQKLITLTTQTTANTSIDTREVSTTISNDEVVVNATVPANPGDYTTSIEAFPEDLPVREELEIGYQITYGSSLSYPSTITLEAEWSKGTLQGASVATIPTLEYVMGSASKAFNSTSPVIDLTNRKITWTITQFPGNTTNQTVTFRLKTTNAYTGTLPVTFNVLSRIIGPGTTTPDSSVELTYRYGVPSAKPTATPGPPATPTPITPTPTPQPSLASFAGMSIPSITATSVQIGLSLTSPGTISLRYGTNSQTFTERLLSPAMQTTHRLTLDNLTPKTQYYFRIQATNSAGRTVTSDIITFTTADVSTPAGIDRRSLVLTSQNAVLVNSTVLDNEQDVPSTVIPHNTPYEFQFSLTDKRSIKQIVARLENYSVLGLSSTAFAQEEIPFTESPLMETAEGIFTGRLVAPSSLFTQLLVLEISDTKGNITQETLAKVRIVKPFSITSRSTYKPIERAEARFSLYNQKTRIYERITNLHFQNPVHTEPDGTLPLVLPKGKYEAEILHPLYERKVVRFTIGDNEGEEYPQVEMVQTPFSFLTYAQYLSSALFDTVDSGGSFTTLLLSSSRFFDLTMLFSLLLLIILTFLTLMSRMHVPIHCVPSYVKTRLSLLNKNSQYLHVIITDGSTNLPIYHAHLYTAHYEAYSDNCGSAYLIIPKTDSFSLRVKKRGYEEYTKTISLSKNAHFVTVELTPSEGYHPVLETEKLFLSSVLQGMVEIFLLASLVISFALGIEKTMLLGVLSLCNCVLWMLHLYDHVATKKVQRDYAEV